MFVFIQSERDVLVILVIHEEKITLSLKKTNGELVSSEIAGLRVDRFSKNELPQNCFSRTLTKG